MGRLRRHRPPRRHTQRLHERLRPRLEATKLLGHGDATRLRQLVTRQQLPLPRRNPRSRVADHRPRRRRSPLLAMAQRPQRTGAVPRGHRRPRRQPTPPLRRSPAARRRLPQNILRPRRHHTRRRRRHPHRLRQPLGHRLPTPQPQLRSAPGSPRLLRTPRHTRPHRRRHQRQRPAL